MDGRMKNKIEKRGLLQIILRKALVCDKNSDIGSQTELLRIYSWAQMAMLPFLVIVIVYPVIDNSILNFGTGLVFCFVAAWFFTFFISFILNFCSDSHLVRAMIGLDGADISSRERMAADLDRVKFFKRKKEYHEALAVVEELLEQDPDYPEALFLKSEILLHGFKNINGADKCLRKLLSVVDNSDNYYKWSKEMLTELKRFETDNPEEQPEA
jgi:tetratricopeptide (TPR) repeat protein